MSAGGHQLALPGPGNERAVTSLKGNGLKKRRRRIKGRRRTSVRGRCRTCVAGLVDDAELRVQFSLVGRRYGVMGSTVWGQAVDLEAGFPAGCRFSAAAAVNAAKARPETQPDLQKSGPRSLPRFSIARPLRALAPAELVRHSPGICRNAPEDASLLAQGAASLRRFAR